MSRMPFRTTRSPNGNRRLTRRSVNIVPGRVPAFRARFPGTVPSMKHAAWRKPVGEYLDATTGSPQESVFVPAATTFGRSVLDSAWRKPVGEYLDATTGSPQESVFVPAATTFGRSVLDPKSKFVSAPVRIANGRPELNSTIGAIVQSLSNRPEKLAPPNVFPDS